MWALTSRFILRYKLFLLVSIGLATFFMAQKAEKVLYSYEFMSLLPEDDPISIEYQEFLSHFGQEGQCYGCRLSIRFIVPSGSFQRIL
jgi:predicted RND superfamily exporter protein